MKISILTCNEAIAACTAMIDAGSPPGLLNFFTGAAPSDTTVADSGTLLATLTFSNTSFGSPTGGIATANAITSGTAVASGTVGYWRAYDAAGTCIAQGTCSTTGADINFNSTTIILGGTVSITSLTWQQPQ